MPGLAHNIERGFLNNLDLHLRDVAETLLILHPLRTLLTIKLEGPDETLRSQYDTLTDIEWEKLINAVLLTKVTYFELNEHFTLEELDLLDQVVMLAMNGAHTQRQALSSGSQLSYPVFNNWLAQLKKWIKYQRGEGPKPTVSYTLA